MVIYFNFCLFGIVVSSSDCNPRGPGFYSRLYLRNFSGSIGSETGSTQPHEDNWVAVDKHQGGPSGLTSPSDGRIHINSTICLLNLHTEEGFEI